jgi:hypothetical protein
MSSFQPPPTSQPKKKKKKASSVFSMENFLVGCLLHIEPRLNYQNHENPHRVKRRTCLSAGHQRVSKQPSVMTAPLKSWVANQCHSKSAHARIGAPSQVTIIAIPSFLRRQLIHNR